MNPARALRALAVFAVAWVSAFALGHALARRMPLLDSLPSTTGAHRIPLRHRDIRQMEAATAPWPAGTAPAQARHPLVHLSMRYRDPATGAEVRSTRAYTVAGDWEPRLRRECGPFAGPVLRRMSTALQRDRRAQRDVRAVMRYAVESDVTLPLRVESAVSQLADGFHDRTRRRLTVTSGTRNPEAQARAMHTKLVLGDDILRLYGGRPVVREIFRAYQNAVAAGLGPAAVRRAMTRVIEAQVARGAYISQHLRAGAVDIRSRDMTPAQKRALLDVARGVPNVTVFEETTPPHFHMTVHTANAP